MGIINLIVLRGWHEFGDKHLLYLLSKWALIVYLLIILRERFNFCILVGDKIEGI